MKRVMMMVPVCLALSATAALAVDQAVKDACREDYHTFCDKLEVGSEELRTCMRKSATSLSRPASRRSSSTRRSRRRTSSATSRKWSKRPRPKIELGFWASGPMAAVAPDLDEHDRLDTAFGPCRRDHQRRGGVDGHLDRLARSHGVGVPRDHAAGL